MPVWLFIDDNLKVEEERGYLRRIETHPEFGYTKENFHRKQFTFGTLALTTNITNLSVSKIFEYFKSRIEIEQMFDTFKNTLKADRSYMRGNYSMEEWMLLVISLVYYYKIYQRLVEKNILSEYTPSDLLLLLSKYRKTKFSTHWISLEIPKKTRKLIQRLSLHIT